MTTDKVKKKDLVSTFEKAIKAKGAYDNLTSEIRENLNTLIKLENLSTYKDTYIEILPVLEKMNPDEIVTNVTINLSVDLFTSDFKKVTKSNISNTVRQNIKREEIDTYTVNTDIHILIWAIRYSYPLVAYAVRNVKKNKQIKLVTNIYKSLLKSAFGLAYSSYEHLINNIILYRYDEFDAEKVDKYNRNLKNTAIFEFAYCEIPVNIRSLVHEYVYKRVDRYLKMQS